MRLVGKSENQLRTRFSGKLNGDGVADFCHLSVDDQNSEQEVPAVIIEVAASCSSLKPSEINESYLDYEIKSGF